MAAADGEDDIEVDDDLPSTAGASIHHVQGWLDSLSKDHRRIF